MRRRLHWSPRLLEGGAILSILAFAAILRFRGITWGANFYVHPDESFMTQVLVEIRGPGNLGAYFNTATSPLNPYNAGFTTYVYGTFPLFLARLVAGLADHTQFGDAHLPGRSISAVADCGTVVLTWWIGRQMFNRAVGLLAALLLAATVLNVQTAHFFTTDAVAAFFATAAFACSLWAWRRQSFAWFALAGLAVGLAAASKPNLLVTAGFLVLPVLEALRVWGLRSFRPMLPKDDEDDTAEGAGLPLLLAAVLALFVTIWTFRIAQPYAFSGPSPFSFELNPQWRADLEYWQLAQSGRIDMPPSIQWTQRAPIVFILDTLVRWGMGPGLGIPALAGLGILLVQFARARRCPSWWTLGLAGFVLFHILFFGTGMSKTQRYLLPAYPMLALLGAATLVAIFSWGWRRGRLQIGRLIHPRPPRWAHPGVILPVIAVTSTILYAIAFSSIYTRPITREVASQWIYDNVPVGSTIATEYWDYGLPFLVPGYNQFQYQNIELDLYATDTDLKASELVGQLNRADVIVISSNRLFESIPRMPDRYPMTIAYYNALFSGDLGFEQVATFTSPPTLFGVSIDDRHAEESLTVYEHPEVLIFRKTPRWSDDAAWTYLHDALGEGGVRLYPVDTQPYQTMLTEGEQRTVDAHATWSDIFDRARSSSHWPILLWYLAFQLVTLPVIALFWRLFPALPDRGYALARVMGTFALGWLAWLVVALGWHPFGIATIVLSWLVIGMLAAILVRRHVSAMISSFRQDWHWIAWTEALFGGMYLLALSLRSGTPVPWPASTSATDPWAPLAAFTATLRTVIFPPPDPGYSGGIVHDAYLGIVPSAVLARLTGAAPDVALRLAAATTFALVAVGGWYSAILVARSVTPRASSRVLALSAPVILVLVGPVDFARRLANDAWAPTISGNLFDVMRGAWRAISVRPDIPPQGWLVTGQVSADIPARFPLHALLSGDVSSATLALPLMIGLLALAFHLSLTIARGRTSDNVLGSAGGPLAIAGPLGVCGVGLGVIVGSGWYGGGVVALVVMGCLVGAIAVGSGWELGWCQIRDAALLCLALVGTAGLSIAPFLARYGVISRATMPLPVAGTPGLGNWLMVSLIPIVLVGGYLLIQARSALAEIRATNYTAMGLVAAGAGLALLGLFLAVLIGSLLVFLVVVVAMLAVTLWYRQHDIGHVLIVIPVAVVALVTALTLRVHPVAGSGGVSLAAAVADLTWLVFGVAAATIVSILIASTHDWRVRGSRLAAAIPAAALAMTALGLVVAGTFPAYAVGERLDGWDAAPTIANIASITPEDAAADIRASRWMMDNVSGLPVMIETPNLSPWAGRVSALTGFPAVIASPDVQIRQRTGLEPRIRQRIDDVNAIYERVVPFAGVEATLQQYDVELVYVGPLERWRYGDLALAKFDTAVSEGSLAVIYQDQDVTIYRYTSANEGAGGDS